MGEELEHADFALNEVWKAGFPELAPEVKEPLRKAQRDWITFRDSQCAADAAAAAHGDKSGVPVFFTDCLTNRTHERRIELEKFFRGVEK